jgi:hypothetical protein
VKQKRAPLEERVPASARPFKPTIIGAREKEDKGEKRGKKSQGEGLSETSPRPKRNNRETRFRRAVIRALSRHIGVPVRGKPDDFRPASPPRVRPSAEPRSAPRTPQRQEANGPPGARGLAAAGLRVRKCP